MEDRVQGGAMRHGPGEQEGREDAARLLDYIGNEPTLWVGSAHSLMLAARRLPMRVETGTLWVKLMLRGFAIENLFKAKWTQSGQRAVTKGRLQLDRELGNHQLAKMAEHVGIDLNQPSRRLMLEALTSAVCYLGRYPVPKHPKYYGMHSEGKPDLRNLWCPAYEKAFWDLVEQFLAEFEWPKVKNLNMSAVERERARLQLPEIYWTEWRRDDL